ncbi:MAG TPA: TonB family protein [Woeseiaceae bacterium]
MDIPYYREYELAWTNTEQEQRFHRLLLIVLAIACVLGAAWPWIPVPSFDRSDAIEVPPRIAKLVLQQKPPPPPPPPREEVVEPEPEPIAEKPVERTVEAEPPEVVPEKAPEPAPEPTPDRTQRARERAAAALLPFTESLADLRDNDVVERVAEERPLIASVGRAERNERSMITSKAGASSGGINTASMSRNTGGVSLGGRATTEVENPVAGVGHAGPAATRSGASGKPSRSREEIELVFDRNKGAIFALYNRALRQDPTLQGKLVLRLTIAPSGEVTACEVVSSELNNPEMEQKLVQRVLLFRFEPKDVESITTTKPIDFFPA